MPIKRDFLRQKTVKTSDKIRLFGVVMTPLKYNVWQWQRTVVYVLLHDCVNVPCVTYIACITQVTLEVIKYTL